SADNRGVPVTQLEPDWSARVNAPTSDGPGGLTINLVALSQLQTDANRSTVVAAFQRAANTWAGRIKTPITITINVDYGVNMPGGSAFPDAVVGSTGSGSVTVDYAVARANLIASASSQSESAIYNSLPASTVPVNTGNDRQSKSRVRSARCWALCRSIQTPRSRRFPSTRTFPLTSILTMASTAARSILSAPPRTR